MSHWNYRVVRVELPSGGWWDSIREVHYNDDGSIYGWTGEPAAPVDTHEPEDGPAEGIGRVLEMMGAALYKPVLTEVDERLVEWERS